MINKPRIRLFAGIFGNMGDWKNKVTRRKADMGDWRSADMFTKKFRHGKVRILKRFLNVFKVL